MSKYGVFGMKEKRRTALAAVVCLAIGSAVGSAVARNMAQLAEQKQSVNSIKLEEIIKPASELTTSKYYYTDSSIFDNHKELMGVTLPFTTDKVVFTYSGVISAGIDMDKVVYTIDEDNKMIIIKLPNPRIMSHETDEDGFKYYDVSNSVFTETSLSDYTNLISSLKKEKESEIMLNEEFFTSVKENAKTIIREMLESSGVTDSYTVIFE